MDRVRLAFQKCTHTNFICPTMAVKNDELSLTDEHLIDIYSYKKAKQNRKYERYKKYAECRHIQLRMIKPRLDLFCSATDFLCA